PTSALDIVASDMTRKNIKELKKQNKTVIVTSHDMKEIANICDRVGIIDKGKIIKIGKINDIIKETKSKKFEEAYLKLISK
ncbi:ABC transporter ATP-binding protein, partial [archaeon]|nr:ABC transporter ATP-binding protein [archaeon]